MSIRNMPYVLCAVLLCACAQEGEASQLPSPSTTETGGSGGAGGAPPIEEQPIDEPPPEPPIDTNEPTPPVIEEPVVDAGTQEPAPEEPVWEPLITADWELQAGDERYFCQRVTLTEDVYFNAIRAINPPGTHHTALTAEPITGALPDGLTVDCGSELSPQGIFGSGPGTDEVFYPDGVGLRLRAGQQVLLNLHIFNATSETLRGTSGTEIVKTAPDAVEHIAESLLAGPTFLDLPAGQETTVTGRCTMTQDTTLFAVQPHMHQLGIHMKGTAESSLEGTKVLHDGDFVFDQQLVYAIEPVQMKQGDVVTVECTFNNTTERRVMLGESSNAEMCFLVLHRYPASDNPAVTCFF